MVKSSAWQLQWNRSRSICLNSFDFTIVNINVNKISRIIPSLLCMISSSTIGYAYVFYDSHVTALTFNMCDNKVSDAFLNGIDYSIISLQYISLSES